MDINEWTNDTRTEEVEKYPFLVFFGATDGNFTEKYSVTPSW